LVKERSKGLICVVTAYPTEAQPVASLMKRVSQIQAPGCRAWKGEVRNRTILLTSGGDGRDNALRMVETCHHLFRPSIYVKFGAAGILSPDIALSSIVIPRSIAKLSALDENQISAGITEKDLIIDRIKIADSLLRNIEKLDVTQTRLAGEVSSPLSSSRIRNWLYTTWGISTVDMESYTVLKRAGELNSPSLAVQVITDCADENLRRDFEKTFKHAIKSGAAHLIDILARLPLP